MYAAWELHLFRDQMLEVGCGIKSVKEHSSVAAMQNFSTDPAVSLCMCQLLHGP